MRRALVCLLLAACSRGHHEPFAASAEQHAQLTSITDFGCTVRYLVPHEPEEVCASKDGLIHAWVVLDDGKLRGINYELRMPASDARAALRRATHGIIDDGLLDALSADLDSGTGREWRYGHDVRGSSQVAGDTRIVSIRWVYE